MRNKPSNSSFEALFWAAMPLYPPHEFSNSCFQRFGNRLNRKKARILDAALDTAQKRPVNIGFGGKRFLRQLFPRPEFPNLLTKSFGNVVTHLRQVCPFAMADGCRLYTTTPRLIALVLPRRRGQNAATDFKREQTVQLQVRQDY